MRKTKSCLGAVLLLASAILISACGMTMDLANWWVGADKPLAYREGFIHGFDSGVPAAGGCCSVYRRDKQRYSGTSEDSLLYKQGWDYGFEEAKEYMQRLVHDAAPAPSLGGD